MRLTPLFAVLFALLLAAPSSAAVPHVVQPGETLWSIAAANNLTTRTVAAFNGLSENSQVVLGSTVHGPVDRRGLRRAAEGGPRGRARRPRPLPPPLRPPRRAAPAAPAAARRLHRAPRRHALRPRRGLARVRQRDRRDERARPERRAARRHRDQAAHRRARARPAPRSRRPPRRSSRRPRPSRPRPALGAGDVQSVAAQHGVSPSLATAIAWQESGFNNAMVSSANARGVMQVMPGTWDYVQQNLADAPARPELGAPTT